MTNMAMKPHIVYKKKEQIFKFKGAEKPPFFVFAQIKKKNNYRTEQSNFPQN